MQYIYRINYTNGDCHSRPCYTDGRDSSADTASVLRNGRSWVQIKAEVKNLFFLQEDSTPILEPTHPSTQ